MVDIRPPSLKGSSSIPLAPRDQDRPQVSPGGTGGPDLRPPSLRGVTPPTPSTLPTNPDPVEEQQRELQLKEDNDRKLKNAPTSQQFFMNHAGRLKPEDIDDLTAFEAIANSFEIGQYISRLGRAGAALRAAGGTEATAEIESIRKRINNLGHDADGFLSWATEASEILGLQYEILTGRDFTIGVTAGGATGAAVGSVVPGIGTAVGAKAGAAAGAASAQFHSAVTIEGGHAYLDMLEMGIDSSAASWLSYGVGIMNGALELVGLAGVTAPVVKAGKGLVKQEIRKQFMTGPAGQVLRNAAKNYGTAVGAETATEMTQEAVNIAAEELGKSFSDIESDLTTEEVLARIGEVGLKTAKGMAILGVPGTTVGIIKDTKEVRRAKKNKNFLDVIHEELQASTVEQEVAEDHATQVLTDIGYSNVFISGERVQEWVGEDVTLADLGLTGDQVEEAIIVGGDVKIGAENLVKAILNSDRYSEISPHIRMNEDALTEFEAQELEESGITEEAINAELEAEREAFDETEPASPVDIAEFEAGLNGMFKSANEAGMTEKQYENYLKAIETSKQKSQAKQQDKVLKQEQKRLTKEWKAEEEKTKAEQREKFSQYPSYQAVNGIQQVRLNKEQVQQIAEEHGFTLDDLPTQEKGRKIYTTEKGEEGVSVDYHAQLYGYEDGAEMLLDMATSLPFEQAVARQTEKIMNERHGNLLEQKQAVIEARKTIHEVDYGSVLEKELNSLRKMRKAKLLTPSVLRNAAKKRIQQSAIRDITPNKFLAAERRQGRQAGIELRKGNIELAADHKFKQLMNYYMAVEAFRVRDTIDKRVEQLKKWDKKKKKGQKLPPTFQEAIRELLSGVDLAPNITARKKKKALEEVSNAVDAPNIPDKYVEGDLRVDYRDMSAEEFNTIYQTVRDIRKKGMEQDKVRKEVEKAQLDETAITIGNLVRENIASIPNAEDRTAFEKLRKVSSIAAVLTFNTDTVLEEIDGGQELGFAYRQIKGRYDDAISVGYLPGSKGYLRRQQLEADNLNKLWNRFTKKELNELDKNVNIPGKDRPIRRRTMLSVMLNMGNQQNKDALLESGQFTQEQLDEIVSLATEKEWKFVQAVWDYLETFWPEIRKAEERRRNYTPEKVEATAIETPYGTFRGGYYPLRYDPELAVWDIKDEDIDVMKNQAQYGLFITHHTRRGHTEQRQAHVGRPLLLDPFIINTHVNEVIYDLEVGDAVNDIFKIITHPEVRQAFVDTGHVERGDFLELWARDVATEEVRSGTIVERSLRLLRTKQTVAALAWNVGVSMVQVLGLLQSSVELGHKNMLWAISTVTFDMLRHNPMTNPNSVFNWVKNETGFMAARSMTHNKDIADARKALKLSVFRKVLPGNLADKIVDSLFFGIRIIQAYVDTVTFIAARRRGMEKFGNRKEANAYADRKVARSQGSGVFGERTPIERGSVNKQFKQSEFVRGFSLLMSFFAAKWNVTVRRTRRTKFDPKHPGEALKWMFDMILLYSIEPMIYLAIKGQLPDEDDELSDWLITGVAETANTLLASIPGVREFGSAARGFPAGGVVTNFFDDFKNFYEQMSQGEFDEAMFRATNNLAGGLLGYPSGQINKIGSTYIRSQQGEDMRAIDWIMGPRFED